MILISQVLSLLIVLEVQIFLDLLHALLILLLQLLDLKRGSLLAERLLKVLLLVWLNQRCLIIP